MSLIWPLVCRTGSQKARMGKFYPDQTNFRWTFGGFWPRSWGGHIYPNQHFHFEIFNWALLYIYIYIYICTLCVCELLLCYMPFSSKKVLTSLELYNVKMHEN